MKKTLMMVALGSAMAFGACSKQEASTAAPAEPTAVTQSELETALADLAGQFAFKADLEKINALIIQMQSLLNGAATTTDVTNLRVDITNLKSELLQAIANIPADNLDWQKLLYLGDGSAACIDPDSYGGMVQETYTSSEEAPVAAACTIDKPAKGSVIERLNALEYSQGEQDTAIAELQEQLGALELALDERLDAIDTLIIELTTTVMELGENVEGLEERIAALESVVNMTAYQKSIAWSAAGGLRNFLVPYTRPAFQAETSTICFNNCSTPVVQTKKYPLAALQVSQPMFNPSFVNYATEANRFGPFAVLTLQNFGDNSELVEYSVAHVGEPGGWIIPERAYEAILMTPKTDGRADQYKIYQGFGSSNAAPVATVTVGYFPVSTAAAGPYGSLATPLGSFGDTALNALLSPSDPADITMLAVCVVYNNTQSQPNATRSYTIFGELVGTNLCGSGGNEGDDNEGGGNDDEALAPGCHFDTQFTPNTSGKKDEDFCSKLGGGGTGNGAYNACTSNGNAQKGCVWVGSNNYDHDD